jgi:hypothetical protein
VDDDREMDDDKGTDNEEMDDVYGSYFIPQ